jgi:hypothetical protein
VSSLGSSSYREAGIIAQFARYASASRKVISWQSPFRRSLNRWRRHLLLELLLDISEAEVPRSSDGKTLITGKRIFIG